MDLNHRPAADVILELFDVCLSLALRVTSTEKTLMTKPITADLYRYKFWQIMEAILYGHLLVFKWKTSFFFLDSVISLYSPLFGSDERYMDTRPVLRT